MTNLEYYKDIEIPSVNREKPRTSFVNHDNREEAIINITNFEKTPYYINLNSKWEFYFKDIATNINQNDPECGEIQVPDLNPTGVYRRKDIKIPQEWFNQERDIFFR